MLPVEQLEIGMYVAQLDRPWLDTPFMFQGFFIRDDDEINELRAHCRHVYVSQETLPLDSSDAVVPAPAPKAATDEKKPGKKRFSLRSLFKFSKTQDSSQDFSQSNVLYRNSASLKEETQTASSIHKQAVVSVQNVMEELKHSGNLDVGCLETAVTPMVDSVLRNPAALACLMRMQKKDDYLYHHSIASSVWATILGRQIGLRREDLDVIALGAMLLDVGKTQLPIEILTKPEDLDDEEQKLMQRHVQFGLDILQKSAEVDTRVLEMVAYHHERYNGTGYPGGLSGNDIPVFGRVAGIVDAYDAMITARPYAKLISSYDALRKLRVLADVEFQAEIVEQFTRAIGVFPTGTLIELNTGQIAVVTKQNRIRRLRPEIMIIMNAEKQLLDQFQVVDLNEEKVASQGNLSLWIETGLPPGSHGIDPAEFYLN